MQSSHGREALQRAKCVDAVFDRGRSIRGLTDNIIYARSVVCEAIRRWLLEVGG